MDNLLGILGIGFLLGIKHALEPDHVIAVSTIVGKHKTIWRSSLLGFFWGLGHTLTLLLVFLVLALTKEAISETWSLLFELVVGVMLVYLGIISFRSSHSKKKLSTEKGYKSENRLFLKSMVIGQIHGMAGSAAMTLIALSVVDSIKDAFVYISLFGIGTIIGMLLFTAGLSIPFLLAGQKQTFNRVLGSLASIISVSYGFYYIYTIGFIDGLFFQ
ncbi:urease accessory protein UreH [Peribacillus cavernae]|uniref:Urease accessory protein UreH n=1 Tax=Peribacillus cavernae TaxID=1674310 RepID=A0A3S0TSA4_9BACI|nr:urease accessory protein UreH [Peribacillus cavernae]MDQ0219553.1 cytochrome c biogenesis protein CcdA [Peribacillus cavernae]RUQ27040.1 urease accessory protein UreH [Peribacillus cavernae]